MKRSTWSRPIRAILLLFLGSLVMSLQAQTGAESDNLALNKTATASSSTAPCVPAMAFDGKMDTYWCSGPLYTKFQWLMVDLGAPQDVDVATINFGVNNFPKSFSIEYEDVNIDGYKIWNTAYKTDLNTSGGTQTCFFKELVRARYFAVYMTMTDANCYIINEFQLAKGLINLTTKVSIPKSNNPQDCYIIASPEGQVISNSPSGETVRKYSKGTVVTLKGGGNPGYYINKWTPTPTTSPTADTISIKMDGDKTATATFYPKYLFLTINWEADTPGSSASGSVYSDPYRYAYAPLTNVKVTALPAAGSTFVGWKIDGGALTDAPNPYLINLKPEECDGLGQKTITAVFKTSDTNMYTLTIDPPGSAGTIKIDPDRLKYYPGQQVQLTALGPEFVSWSVSKGGATPENYNSNPLKISMYQNTIVKATYKTYTLTSSVDPADGGTMECVPPGPTYNSGTLVTLKATAKKNFRFSGWEVNDKPITINPTTTLTMDASKTVKAKFIPTCILTSIVEPAAGGTITYTPSKPGGVYDAGESVTLTATASTGYSFVNWTVVGSVTTTGPTLTLTMNTSQTVKATFVKIFTLTATVEPLGSGTIVCDPLKTVYDPGDNVTITAIASSPSAGVIYVFKGWMLNGAAPPPATITSDNKLKVIMDAAKTVKAVFKPTYVLSTSVEPSDGGSISCDILKTAYDPGEIVTLTPNAKAGYTFAGWTIGTTDISITPGSSPMLSVTMNAGMNVKARFTKVTPDPNPATCSLNTIVEPIDGGNINCVPEKTGGYVLGEKVELTAIEKVGFVFKDWIVGTAAPVTSPKIEITMDEAKTVKARFSPKTAPGGYSLTVINGTGGNDYLVGENISITAAPAPSGLVFCQWVVISGKPTIESVTSETTTLTMPASDVEVTATYKSLHASGPGVYGGVPFYKHRDSIDTLRSSGFKWTCIRTIHIMNSNGDLNLNTEFPIVQNGTYVGNAKYPFFAIDVAKLKVPPTSIQWIEIGLSAWESNTFGNIRDLINTEGTGPDTKLYKNFKALKEAIPSIDSISFDDEKCYDISTTTKFAIMLADLGYKVSICPKTKASYWKDVVSNVNNQSPGTIKDVHLQCYAAGSANDPCTWKDYFEPEINVMPGIECSSNVGDKIHTWNNTCDIHGGWLWLYEKFFTNSTLAKQYAQAIDNNIKTVAAAADDDNLTINEVEPNDNVASANSVHDTATTIVGTIDSKTDLDFFTVNVAAGATLAINMTGPSLDYDLYLYDSSGAMLMGSLNPNNANEMVTYTNTGTSTVTTTVLVLGYANAYSNSTPYTLTIKR